jgi:Mrp family chromosome partitioning ATPase
MTRLIEELETLADVVLFDIPPVLVSADAMLLASHVNGVLLAIASRSTRREMATRSLERLRSMEARVLGAVLNKVQTGSSSYYYSSNKEERKGLSRLFKRLRRGKHSGSANKEKRKGLFRWRFRAKNATTAKRVADERQSEAHDALAR